MLACDALTCGPPAGGAGPGLSGITLHADAGEVLAVVGVPRRSPGILLRVLAGRTAPERGSVRVAGRSVHQAVEAGAVGYVLAGATGPATLTAVEWLQHVAALRGGKRAARATRVQAALALVGLGPEAERRIATLDRDAAEQLAVATLAVGATGLLLLDECFAGIHGVTRRLLSGALLDLALQGRTIVLAPRDILAVEGLATRVVLLRQGHVLADLRMSDVQRERVAELRFGGAGLGGLERLVAHFPDAVRTGSGAAVPLRGGRTLESVLAVCRMERLPVQGSAVRYHALDDLLAGPAAAPDPVRVGALG